MIWAYVLDVSTWFQNDLYIKYGQVFPYVWTASAYKGAYGELAIFTNIEQRYKNHISWNKVMYDKEKSNYCKFRGIALTGWSR